MLLINVKSIYIKPNELNFNHMWSLLSLLFIIGRDNVIELIEGDRLVGSGLILHKYSMHHLHNLLLCHWFSNLPSYGLQLLELNHTCLLLIIQVEYSPQAILCLHLASIGAHNIDKVIKRKRPVGLAHSCNNIHNIGVAVCEAHLLQHFGDFGGFNCAAVVDVEDEEGLA